MPARLSPDAAAAGATAITGGTAAADEDPAAGHDTDALWLVWIMDTPEKTGTGNTNPVFSSGLSVEKQGT